MALATTAELTTAHEEVVALIGTIPGAALDWQPDGGDWSLKQIIGHVAHAYDFYVTIVEEGRARDFGIVRLHRDLAGWQRMLATDAAIARCVTVPAALARVEQAYQDALVVFQGLTLEEIDRPFVFQPWQPDAGPLTTTLRQRVLAQAASRLREHQAQLADTLARWRAAHQAL